MKLHFGFVLFVALILGVTLLPAPQVKAQDTLLVQWQNTDGSIIQNALLNAFRGDTINRPAGRVYKLKAGGYYANTERIENSGRPLRIVGEWPGSGADQNPPVLQMYRRSDGSVDQRMITGLADLTLKNLWITGADDIGTQTAYQFIQIDGSGITVIVDNCIFDRSNFAPIAFQNAANCKIYYTNNKFRNLIERPITQQWTGRGICVWANEDTVVIENNTFFNIGCFPLQMESGAIKYLRFNHNTMVNVGRNFGGGNWWREAYFTNNLFINPFFQGEGAADYLASGRDPRSYSAGIWGIGPLPSSYGPEQGRRILFGYNAAWRDPQFATGALYGDTVRAQYYIGDVTRLDYLEGAPYKNMVVRDTTWLPTRPNIATYPDTLIPKMWQSITDLRRGITPATPWFFNLPTYAGQECFTCVDWPLPDDFSYSSPANLLTAGTDHLPLGDLNWFPAAKNIFELNKAQYVDDMQNLAGEKVTYTLKSTYEAETGTLGGGATVAKFPGFSWFLYKGSGNITWTFNVTTAGQYDLRFWVHERSRGQSGPVIKINNTEVHDRGHGWGQFIFDVAGGPANGLPNNQWIWVNVGADTLLAAETGTLTWAAGTNTIAISSGGWGEMGFAGIDVIRHGTTDTLKLRAPDATYAIVTASGEGAPWVPSAFKSVAMGTNGSVTLRTDTLLAADVGNYAVQLFYQNIGTAAKTAQIALDGSTVVPSVSLAGKADSTGTNVLTQTLFPVAAGPHTLTVSGSDFNLDIVQLIKVVATTGVPGGEGLPVAYALEQNYPNPFNPSTVINFSLPKASQVELTVYNILGQKVATLVNGQLNAGVHSVQFDARNLASGVYFYRIDAAEFMANKKMMLLK